MQNYPKIAVIYLSFHCEPYIEDVVNAMKSITYPKVKVAFVIVDNPHPTHGDSIEYINENVMPLSEKELPKTVLLSQKTNLGFAGGNNEGIKWALENGYDYVYFHNNDGFVKSNCFEPLIQIMEDDKTIGVAQSLMLLHPETELINSTGNSYHYLGFGFCDDYKSVLKDASIPAIKEIAYASGAAVMMRADLLKKYGLWDEDFFLYHEDLEYSFRLKVAGYRSVMVKDSVFYHKYEFSRSISKYYWMERNRYAVLLMFFKIPTLIILFPMLLILEIGLFAFAIKGGWVKEKLKVYKYWLKPSSWKLWLYKRKGIQKIRLIRDRDLLKMAAKGVLFQEPAMQSKVLKYIGNPLMSLYYTIVIKTLIWI